MEYDRDRNAYSASSPSGDAKYYSYMQGAIVPGFMSATNKAEVDCLLCHLNDNSGTSGNGRAWLKSMGCGSNNPMGPMNDPTCSGTSYFPGVPDAGSFTPGTKYDMYNRNLALKTLSFNYAASLGIGATVSGWGQDANGNIIITGISGVPSTISAANINPTPNSQNCSVCHARDDNTPGLPGMINMKYGYGNYAMINPAGTALDVDKPGTTGTNDVLWFELGCKTGMGKRAQRIGQGPNANWGMSMFNVMFGLNRNPGAPVNTETIASTTFPGMSVSTKERMPDSDVHDMAGMQCATCHYSIGSKFLKGVTTDSGFIADNAPDALGTSVTIPAVTDHGVSYPAETIYGIDHMFAQGDDLKDTYGRNNLDSTVSCESCHTTRTNPRLVENGGTLISPTPALAHTQFPAFHFQKIACTTCHIPEVYAAPGRLKYRDHSVGYYKKGEETNGGFRNMLDWNYDLITGSHKTTPVLHVWATRYGEKKITPVLPSEMPIWVRTDNPSNTNSGSSDGQTPDLLTPGSIKTCNFGEKIFYQCSSNADCPDGSCVDGVTSWAAPAKGRDITAAAKTVEATGVLRRTHEINTGNMVPLFDGFSLADAWAVDTKSRIDAMAGAGAGAVLKVFHANFDVTHGVPPKEWALGGSKRGGCASCHSSIDPYSRSAMGMPTGPNPNYSPYSVGFFESYQQPLEKTGFGIGQYDMVKNWFSLFADYDCTMMCGGGAQPDSTYFDMAGNPIMGAACGDPFGMGWSHLSDCVNFMTGTFDTAMGFPSGTAMMMGMYDGISGLQGFVVRETLDGKTHGCQPFAGPVHSSVAQAFGVDVNNCMPNGAMFNGTCTGAATPGSPWPASCVGGFRNGQGCAPMGPDTNVDCKGSLDSTEAAHNQYGLIYQRSEVRNQFKIMLQQSEQIIAPSSAFPAGVNRLWWPILTEQNPDNPSHKFAWDMAGSANVCGPFQNQPCCTEMDGMTPASCAPGKVVKTTIHANQFLGYDSATLATLMNPSLSFTISASAGPNGTISPAGNKTVMAGESLSVSITPASGYRVADVLVDGVSIGATTSYTFWTVAANHTISASFTLDVYTITAAADVNGSITPSGTITVNGGANQTFTITPNAGYQVLNVLVDGASAGAVTSYTFSNVKANHTINAYFKVLTYTITSTAGAGGSISPPGTTVLNVGASQTYTVTPAAGDHVTDVLVDGVSVGAVTTYPLTNVTANHTISATFAANSSYTITASAGANGTISPSGGVSVLGGANQKFTITPAAGYRVADVQVDGTSVGALTSYTFYNVQATHTISATFVLNVYSINVTAATGGSVTVSGASITTTTVNGGTSSTITVNPGASVTLTITPDAGRSVRSLVDNGSYRYGITTYTLTSIGKDHTINVYFK